MNVDIGFDRSRLVTFGLALPASTYPNFDQLPHIFPTMSGPHLGEWPREGSMNLVLRSALPMAARATRLDPIAALREE